MKKVNLLANFMRNQDPRLLGINQLGTPDSLIFRNNGENRQITLDVDATMNVIVNSAEPKLLKSVAVEDFFVSLHNFIFS